MFSLVLTTGEVAAALHVTIPTVKRWVREGHLASFRTAGGHHRIAADEVARFRAARHIPQAAGEGSRVLVVEDDPALRPMIGEALRRASRHRVETAADGYEGLIKVGTFRPHLLILDVRMPRLDGYEVCRTIKDDPATYGTVILAVTGYGDGAVRERLLAAGASGYLEKPLAPPLLLSEVERLLSFASASDPEHPVPAAEPTLPPGSP
jgi:excisionase family DNA binding protein